jgi:hypothetical protein
MYHWNNIKNILQYLHEMTDLRLFFIMNKYICLLRYTDDDYLSNPKIPYHKQIAIYWKSSKQTLAMSTNHSEKMYYMRSHVNVSNYTE